MSTKLVAKNIEYLCQMRGISARQLAIDMKMSPSSMYRLVNPENTIEPRARTLRNIADYFKVDPIDLTAKDLAAVSRGASASAEQENQSKSDEYGNGSAVVFGHSLYRLGKGLSGADGPQASIFGTVAADLAGKKNAEADTEKTETDSEFKRRGVVKTTQLMPLVVITNPRRFVPEDYFAFVSDYGSDEQTQNVFGFKVEEWIPAPFGISEDTLTAYRVVGDAMNPTLENGDIAFVTNFDEMLFDNRTPKVESGDIVLAKGNISGNPTILIRKAVKNEAGDVFLVATNPSMAGAAIRADAVYGKVVGVTRRL